MGNEQTQSAGAFKQVLEMNYKVMWLGSEQPAQIYKRRDGSDMIIKQQQKFQNNEEAEAFVKSIKRRAGLKSGRLVQIFHTETEQVQSLCGMTTMVNVYYEHLEKTLSTQINRRVSSGLNFHEGEIQDIVIGLAQALSQIHKSSYFLTRFNANNVKFTHFKHVKLIDPILVLEGKCFEANKFNYRQQLEKGYLSPEELDCIRNEKTQMRQKDPFATDIFTAGMIILEACTLKSPRSLYRNNYTISRESLDLQLGLALQNYRCARVLSQMLHFEDSKRLTAGQLLRRARNLELN